MSDTTNKVSHTADRIEHVAKGSAKEKQVGNTRALLFQNLPLARTIRSGIGGTLGILETTGDALYRTMTLAARPQDIKHTGKILRNGIKATIAESPQIKTNGLKEYRQNLRAPKLTRDTTKQYHDPYLDETKFFDTHGTDLSLAPKKSDNRFKKIVKGIPFIAGKVVKTPVRAASTVIGVVADTARWAKAQKLRDLVTFDFAKTNRNKTSHAWNKLTSRAYHGNTSDVVPAAEDKKEEVSDTKADITPTEKKSFRSRLRPFSKKKKENTTTKEVKKIEESPKQIDKKTTKEETKDKPTVIETKIPEEKETISPETIASIVAGHTAIEELKRAFENKDKKSLDQAKDKILRAQATEKYIDKDNLSDEYQTLFKEIKSTATDIGQLKYKIEDTKVIDIKESNEAMGDYINEEQRRFTKLYNNKEEITKQDSEKRIKSLQKYQKSGGKIVFTGKQNKAGDPLSGNLDSLKIEDNIVKVGFTTDDGHKHTDQIEIAKVFDSKFSVHAPDGKDIDISEKIAA